MPGVWWLLWAALVVLLAGAYLVLLAARVSRLHRRAEAAASALDASLARRAAAVALLADELAGAAPQVAVDLHAAVRAALDARPDGQEAAENDLTQLLRKLPPTPADGWEGWGTVVTASRRLSLARQVHTDVVRDAQAVGQRRLVRAFGLAFRHERPAYFDVGDPGLDDHPREQRE